MQGKAHTPGEMEAFGHAAGKQAQPGSIFALTGGLGAGKTHWTKGFAAARNASAEVTSPTFSLVHEYPSGQGSIYHFDFYRLASPEELLALGWDEYLEAGGIVIAEWADKFPGLLPPSAIWLKLSVNPDGSRTIERVNA